jgi:hypothetical protein
VSGEKPDIVELASAAILMHAGSLKGGILRMDSGSLFEAIDQYFGDTELSPDEFQQCVGLLRKGGLATSSFEADFWDRFHRVEFRLLESLIKEADLERDEVDAYFRGSMSITPPDQQPNLDFLRAYPAFKQFRDFGDAWLLRRIATVGVRGEQIGGISLHNGMSETQILNAQNEVVVARSAIDKAQIPNTERARALAYLNAVDSLLTSPEPDRDLIWTILERANSLAGIAGFFLALIAVFK